MARDIPVSTALYVGFATAVGLASIGIAIIDHKRATARGERMAYPKGKKFSPFEYVILAGAACYTLIQTAEIATAVINDGDPGALLR